MTVKIKRIRDGAILPSYAHPDDAGMDLYACEDVEILPGCYNLVHTGLVIELPSGMEAQIRPRSGLALHHGITVLNAPGTVDAGYRGEIGVILINHSSAKFHITPGMRIAQMVFSKVRQVELAETPDIAPSVRGACGFGSSGTGGL